MAFKLGMTVDLCIAYNYAPRFDDLDLDARSQQVRKGKKISFELSRQLSKQAISIKIATTVGHFLSDLEFKNVYMA